MSVDDPGDDRHRADDWDTSREAGEQADPKGECRAAVHLAHLNNPFGLTDEEMYAIVDSYRDARGMPRWPDGSMRKRRTDLFHDGVLVATSLRGLSAAGRPMIVWRLRKPDEEASPRRPRANGPAAVRRRAARVEALSEALRADPGLYQIGAEIVDGKLYVCGDLDLARLAQAIETPTKETT